jgi:tetratricopeptide (TPR) repeat protein
MRIKVVFAVCIACLLVFGGFALAQLQPTQSWQFFYGEAYRAYLKKNYTLAIEQGKKALYYLKLSDEHSATFHENEFFILSFLRGSYTNANRFHEAEETIQELTTCKQALPEDYIELPSSIVRQQAAIDFKKGDYVQAAAHYKEALDEAEKKEPKYQIELCLKGLVMTYEKMGDKINQEKFQQQLTALQNTYATCLEPLEMIQKINIRAKGKWKAVHLVVRHYSVITLFHLYPEGKINNLHIIGSSGNIDADNAVLQAVESSFPFKSARFPAHCAKFYPVQLIFDYDRPY